MSQLRKILDRILNVLAGVSFLAMVALTCWQVFTRYILKNPSSWSEEMVSYLFGWMALLGPSRLDRQLKKKKEMFLWLFRGVGPGPAPGEMDKGTGTRETVQTGR